MGGVRTALAKVGIGIIGTNSFIYERNVLDTPRHAPAKYDSTFYRGKAYIGEDDTYVNDANVAITYDMSRYKIPDGQLIVQFAKSDCNDGYYFVPTTKFMLNQLAWFQTLFNKKLDLKLGWINNNSDFIGSTVGGNFANTFGPGESIPVLIGMSLPPAPTVRFTWHVNDNVYEEFAVQRSLPVSGATGFPYYDEGIDNPYGIHFNSSISGTGELFINEFGYRQNPGPGRPSTWLRYTMMYNNSKFTDYSQLATGGTERGESAQSFLLDRQLWQQNPSSYATAYRGIYAGLTYQYAPSTTSPVTGYYEGRLYWIGPTPRRSSDLVQIVYGHNEKSKYLVDFSNKNNKGTDLIAQDRSNTYTTSYVAHLKRGIFASGGFSYTDRPSGTYFIGEGSSLNFLSSVYLVF
jgi:porin